MPEAQKKYIGEWVVAIERYLGHKFRKDTPNDGTTYRSNYRRPRFVMANESEVTSRAATQLT